MSRHNLKYENFAARIPQNAVVYGGFMFNVVMDNYDKDSDVDIIHYNFVDGKYQPTQSITVNRGKYNTLSVTYENCDKYITSQDGSGMYCYPLIEIKIDGSSTDGLMYQHLTLLHKTTTISEYLDRHCDLDITKIYYDGEKIKIKDVWKLLERRDETDLRINYQKSLNFYNWDEKWSLNEYYRIYNRCYKRAQKYINRGIKIKFLYGKSSFEHLKYLMDCYMLDSSREWKIELVPVEHHRIVKNAHLEYIINRHHLFVDSIHTRATKNIKQI
jgi:hypothetical protein